MKIETFLNQLWIESKLLNIDLISVTNKNQNYYFRTNLDNSLNRLIFFLNDNGINKFEINQYFNDEDENVIEMFFKVDNCRFMIDII